MTAEWLIGPVLGFVLSLLYLRWLAWDVRRLSDAAHPALRLLIGFALRLLAVAGVLYGLLVLLGPIASLSALAAFMLGRWFLVRRIPLEAHS